MFQHLAVLLASTAASTANRIFGAQMIERHIDHFGGMAGYTRSRGKSAKPRKRPNMRIVSKRVRRKHRRAA